MLSVSQVTLTLATASNVISYFIFYHLIFVINPKRHESERNYTEQNGGLGTIDLIFGTYNELSSVLSNKRSHVLSSWFPWQQ